MTYTKQTLQQDLAAMGLTGTETILIHSAMKSIGAVEGLSLIHISEPTRPY